MNASKALAVAYGVFGYVVFLASFLYAVGFLGNIIVPKAIDSGPKSPPVEAVAVNVLLLGLFAVQHSVMARPAFKNWWTRIVPQPIERSTYVLLSSLALMLLYWQWRSLPSAVWAAPRAVAIALWVLYAFGWLVVLVSTFLIDHFELFGLRQVFEYATDRPIAPACFRTPGLYRVVRHPIMLGFIVAFWAAPVMSWGRLLFAAASTAYIAVGVWFEEGDLRVQFGDAYEDYRRRVPAIVPLPSRQSQ